MGGGYAGRWHVWPCPRSTPTVLSGDLVPSHPGQLDRQQQQLLDGDLAEVAEVAGLPELPCAGWTRMLCRTCWRSSGISGALAAKHRGLFRSVAWNDRPGPPVSRYARHFVILPLRYSGRTPLLGSMNCPTCEGIVPRAMPLSQGLPSPRRTSARACPFRPDCPGGTAPPAHFRGSSAAYKLRNFRGNRNPARSRHPARGRRAPARAGPSRPPRTT